ncbi:MAG: CobD/CbiB family protein [Betaproteobacteria bacterium]|nr:CobD/CbiB family protein [Betaproteobacteria bacterium]
MKFLSIVAALLIEQLYPVRQDNPVYGWFARYAATLDRHFNGGQYRHGVIAWALAVAPPVLATVAVSLLLARASPVLAWLWSVVVLYLTMGFRQFSHYFTETIQALQEDRIDKARELLAGWRGEPAGEFSPSAVARVSIELGLIGSHRHVFGPVACFIVLGPAGAVLYRLSAMLAEKWGMRQDPELGDFGRFAGRFFSGLDWVPSRLTAASFAIVGNFEDAVYCWRTQARSWAVESHGILLASGGGAIGVRLGDTLQQHGGMQFRPEMGTGDDADADYMRSTVGLIWRALVLWMFLVLIVTVAHSLG